MHILINARRARKGVIGALVKVSIDFDYNSTVFAADSLLAADRPFGRENMNHSSLTRLRCRDVREYLPPRWPLIVPPDHAIATRVAQRLI